jgi:hypothetical protein
MVITGVAEHARDRIAHLVYVDALVPEHGQSAMDILPEPTRNTFRKLADEGGGWRMRPNEHLLDLWGLEDGPARAFVHEAAGGLHHSVFLAASRGAHARGSQASLVRTSRA